MKKKFIVLPVILMVFCVSEVLSNRPLQKKVEQGVWVPQILVTASGIKNLPVPETKENYAILQSIDTVTNVITGQFLKGDGEITLYRDSNNDGKVDYIARWLRSENKIEYLPLPGKKCPPEKFKQMKTDILNGTRNNGVYPNKEGGDYIKKVVSGDNDSVTRSGRGFRVIEYDPDETSRIRTSFFFENKAQFGVNAVFEVKFHHRGRVNVSPVIPIGVYCKNSKDPLIINYMKDLVKYTAKTVTD